MIQKCLMQTFADQPAKMLRVFEDGRRNPHGSTVHYGQLCKALLDLQDAADKIFDTVSNRVGAEHQRLKGLSSRIRTAKAKVDAIAGTKRAITVKSSSRYPSVSSDSEDFCPLFGGEFGGIHTDFPVATLSLNGGLSRESREDGTLELFRFFSETSHEYFSDNNRKVGIGNMRSDINSVTETLLFNSTDLPYHSYKTVDNLVAQESSFAEERSELKHAPLPPPPQSVLRGSTLSSAGSEDFGFRPTLREVPSFSLPSTLPDLPMVAEISWSGSKSKFTQHYSTTPSLVGSIAPKNDVNQLKSDSGSVQGLDEYSSISSVSEHDSSSQRSCSLNEGVSNRYSNFSQPLTSSKAIHMFEQNANSKEISSQPVSPMPPPPPPPPLTPLLTPLSSSEKQKNSAELAHPTAEMDGTSRSSSLPQIDSQRLALMASIRDPGIMLRKTGFADYNSNLTDSFTDSMKNDDSLKGSFVPKPKSVNLLAEMAASLKMRRLSMQGAAHDKEQMALRSSEQMGVSDSPSPSTSSVKFALPISNLHAYIAKRNEELSEEEDWED
eukprot:Gb_21332 [translate_table: standard]